MDEELSESATEELLQWIERVATTDMSVLLLGETGAGKGYFAHLIHAQSHRASGPFMHINCAALPDNLLESELFGYEKGAFSGAAGPKPGLLEAASGGTVFLDEVGEMALGTQAKLLVALERREVMRIGAVKPRPFDVRFIAATNQDIDALSGSGKFRADLFFRIAGLPLTVPPLRERRSEIPALARNFLVAAAERMRRPAPQLSEDALDVLVGHPWPGNVRELITTIDRAVLIGEGTLTRAHLMASLNPTGSRASKAPPTSTPGLPAAPASARGTNGEGDAEAERIRDALDKCAGNQSRAAEMLGISRRTLLHKLDALGLPRPRKR